MSRTSLVRAQGVRGGTERKITENYAATLAQNLYDKEVSDRTAADDTLQGNIDAEARARAAADNAEATAREAEDDAIANGTREINPMLGFDTTYRKAGQAPKSIADGLNMLTLLSGQTDEFNLDGSFRADWLRAAVLLAGKLRIGADYIATWDNKSISEGLSMLTGIVESGTESDVYKCLKDVVFTDNYFDFGNIIVSGEEDWYYPENECNDYDLLTVGRKIKFTIDASSNNARHSWLSIHVPFGSFYLWVHHKDTFWEGRTYTAIITTKNGLNTEYNFSDGEAYVIEDSSNTDYLSEIAKKILKIPTYATEAEIREAWSTGGEINE